MSGEESVEDLIRELETLSLRGTEVARRLRAARGREAAGQRPPRHHGNVFQVNDRVRIANGITVLGRRATEADRRGTVTKITAERVRLLTDSGLVVRRAPHNLTPLPNDE